MPLRVNTLSARRVLEIRIDCEHDYEAWNSWVIEWDEDPEIRKEAATAVIADWFEKVYGDLELIGEEFEEETGMEWGDALAIEVTTWLNQKGIDWMLGHVGYKYNEYEVSLQDVRGHSPAFSHKRVVPRRV